MAPASQDPGIAWARPSWGATVGLYEGFGFDFAVCGSYLDGLGATVARNYRAYNGGYGREAISTKTWGLFFVREATYGSNLAVFIETLGLMCFFLFCVHAYRERLSSLCLIAGCCLPTRKPFRDASCVIIKRGRHKKE